MNTDLIYVSNIPSSIKPVLLLHELENKWSRMLYLENSFSGMRDAFIYNPTPSLPHFHRGVQKLRNKVFEDSKTLSVSYVWFPPPNVFITTMIPEGASMLSYIFVENLPKDGNLADLTADLPFQQHDIKLWDIPERQDKCMVIKLPPSSNAGIRSFVIGVLKNRKVGGYFPHVYEVLVSNQPELSQIMVPKTIKSLESRESFMANLLFVDNIPSKLNVKSLVDSTKFDNIKGCRVFFLEAMNKTKLGFIYIPKSLPLNKFNSLLDKLKNTEYPIDDGTSCKITLDETWFQPCNADPPQISKDELSSTDVPEFTLTHYVYLHNIPTNVIAAQLLMGCPFSVKLYVFTVNDLSTQIGFIVLRGLTPDCCQIIIDHFRNLVIGGFPILVDEIYLKCYNSPELEPHDVEHIRRQTSTNSSRKKRCIENSSNGGDGGDQETNRRIVSSVSLTRSPPEGCPLMKSEFICLSNLPKSMSRSAIVFDIGVVVGGCVLTTCSDGKTFGFIYLPDCDPGVWERVIGKLASKCVQGNFMKAHEVYLQSNDGSPDLISDEFQTSQFIFIYNLPMMPVEGERALFEHEMIFDIAFLDTDSGSRCAIGVLNKTSNTSQINDCLNYIKSIKIGGRPVYVDLIWLSDVQVNFGQPPVKKLRGLAL